MKKTLAIIVVALSVLSLNAQTNTVTPVSDPDVGLTNTVEKVADKNESGSWELTLGGGGVYVPSTKESQMGVNFTLSTNPFKKCPSWWIGIEQGFTWQPTFAGSTDFLIDRSTHLLGQLYLNTGWTAGLVYDRQSEIWRTGPELTFEYYIGSSSFLFAGANYDIMLGNAPDGLRYSWGIGLTW